MSKTITVTLTDAEFKALEVVAVSAQDWVDNVVHHRCEAAIDEIVAAEVQRKLAAGETISGSKEEIVLAANLETGAEKNARLQAEFQARIALQQTAQQGA
jgi:hypothetical protein